MDTQPPPVLTAAALATRMVYDICQCSHAAPVRAALGLGPMSAEVAQAEHGASHARLAAIVDLGPAIEALASAAAATLVVSAGASVKVAGPEAVKDVFIEGYATLLATHLAPAMAAALANLVDCEYVVPIGGGL